MRMRHAVQQREREGELGTDARYAYETPLPDIPVEASTASTIPRPIDGVATGAAPGPRLASPPQGYVMSPPMAT